ncbi:hypothetical protein B0H16DRAFT_1467097 [Mycena metata]|uniref:Uncharacterized protein n=1 Tax=Mycena metata TaxID=1033252 RepID=A0AAD7MWN0_9AGAR|nr:hypothetical protein B0H16DRAFT_1467097 [Mycena metata]
MRLNDVAAAAVRTVDWDARWCSTVERSWWWVLAGVVGRIPRAVDSAAPGKRLDIVVVMIVRCVDSGGMSAFVTDAYSRVSHHAVSLAVSPHAVDRDFFLLAPIRRPPRIPPKRNTMNFKTICDTTGHNSLGRASRDATEPGVLSEPMTGHAR